MTTQPPSESSAPVVIQLIVKPDVFRAAMAMADEAMQPVQVIINEALRAYVGLAE